MSHPPPWLSGFQKRFGSMLRQPLDSSTGTFLSKPKDHDLGVQPRSQRSAMAGLSDYHRQYWFRLFTTMQNEFPLTSRLLGLWSFNLLAQNFLQSFPPTDYDLQSITKNFLHYLQQTPLQGPLPKLALMQATQLDEARQLVFAAPHFQPWKLHEGDAERLASLSFNPAPDWRIVQEDWALLDLCLRLQEFPGEQALPLPARHPQPQAWLIHREQQGLFYRPLPALQARLYQLLTDHNLGSALAIMEKDCPAEQQSQLQNGIQQWMALSIQWGLWAEKEFSSHNDT